MLLGSLAKHCAVDNFTPWDSGFLADLAFSTVKRLPQITKFKPMQPMQSAKKAEGKAEKRRRKKNRDKADKVNFVPLKEAIPQLCVAFYEDAKQLALR